MKSYISLLLILIAFTKLGAQGKSTHVYDIQLKSKLTIRASVEAFYPGKGIRINQLGQISFIADSLIDNVIKVARKSETRITRTLFEKKWYAVLEPSLIVGQYSTAWPNRITGNTSIQFAVHRMIKPNMSVGFGMGGQYFTNYETATVDLKPEFRFYTQNQSRTPYFYVQPGYSLNSTFGNAFSNGGLFIGAGMGKIYQIRGGEVISFSFGLRHQQFNSEQTIWDGWGWNQTTTFFKINRFEFKLGFGI